MDTTRYSGPPATLYEYRKEFVVECPKCKNEATITSDNPFDSFVGKLSCKNCMHAEDAQELVRYRFTVKRNCDSCGKAFETILLNQKSAATELTLPCPHCGVQRTYTPKCETYKTGYESPGYATDPVFNLPLWLQAEVRGDLFWAFNREHLREIKNYVMSKLRERQSDSHTTMVEKLPQFIKDAKNRDTILKVIERLERK